VNDTSHLGGNCSECLATEIRAVAIPGDVTFELVAEAVLALTDGNLTGNPEAPSQASIAELGEPGLSAVLAGLLGREIEAAELQELPMMTEPSQIAGLRQDGQGDDRADAGYPAECLIINTVMQEAISKFLDLVTLLDQTARLGNHHPEHPDGRSLELEWQTNGCSGRLVNI
jgi:hypothetical protein